MSDFTFPFPGKELAAKELSYDLCYSKIAEADRDAIAEQAWHKGEDAARDAWDKSGGNTDFFQIAAESGLSIEKVKTDYIVGGQRYFSDYISGQGKIHLYTGSVAKWAEQNHLTQEQAENLILSHEYFHFLEWTAIGLSSRMYQVPMLQIGKLKLGKTGIRALSEIGAHAFARTYYELYLTFKRSDES